MHEIGHAIGLVHTMRRSDRDNYVIVHYDNINPASNRNFDTTTTSGITYSLYNTPYDYSSIMHYTPKVWLSCMGRSLNYGRNSNFFLYTNG